MLGLQYADVMLSVAMSSAGLCAVTVGVVKGRRRRKARALQRQIDDAVKVAIDLHHRRDKELRDERDRDLFRMLGLISRLGLPRDTDAGRIIDLKPASLPPPEE